MFKKSRLNIAAISALAGVAALPVWAQDTAQRVEITGSSIKRLQGETALPIQVLTNADIQRSGATTVEQLMQTISAVSSSGGLTASSASGATTGGISSISLRGLTSVRTLVLINGRRIAPYGIGFTNDSVSVDVNSIPLAAIERVEILKDGASAIYGSDAIAGVVNFILRKDFRGVDLSADYTGTTRGGAAAKRASATWGIGDLSKDRFNLMIVGSIQKEDALFGRDRDFSKHAFDVDRLNDTTSGNTFPANIAATDGSFGSRNPTAAVGCVAPYSFIDPLFPADRCRFDPASLVTLLPGTERVSLFGAAKFALGKDLEAYAEASFNRSKQRTVIQPVPISDQFTIPSNNPLAGLAPYNLYTTKPSSTIILTSSSPFYPTAYVSGLTGGPTPDLFVRYRAALNGNRDLSDISEAPRATFGLRGVLAGWDFDTSALYSESKVTEQVNDGYPIYSKILPLLNSGTVNFFGANTGPISAQLRATNFTGAAFKVSSSLTSLTGKASRDLLTLPGGPLALALGAELRREKYDFRPSAEISQGDVSGYGGNIAAVNKTRQVTSAFGEVSIPFVKGLDGDLAVRYDNYQGVGSSVTPKASLRWQPLNELLLRASIGKGFRAPSLADLYTPRTDGVSQTGLTDPVRCPTTADGIKDCSTQFGTTNGGNLRLKSEKSDNLTFGILLEPTKDLTVGFDAFKITLKDTISQGLAQSFILANLTKYGSFVTRGAVDLAFPTLPGPIISIDQTNINTGETRLAGVDVDLKWRLNAGDVGRFVLAFNGTYFMKYDIQNPDLTFSRTVGNLDQSTSGGVIPRWKTYQSITWSRGNWDITGAFNWQSSYLDVPGSFEDPTDPTFVQRRVANYETIDAQASYTGVKNLRLTLGVKNLLDRNPPYSNQGFSFQSGYDPQYGDPRGRTVYFRVGYAFQ